MTGLGVMDLLLNLGALPIWGGDSPAPAPAAPAAPDVAPSTPAAAGCPDWAPFPTANGGCSNTEPVAAWMAAAGLSNPFTGAPVPWSPVVQAAVDNSTAIYSSRASAEAIDAEAERQGSALGLPTSCSVVETKGPQDLAPRFDVLCSVAGSPAEYSGNLLIRPGGWQINATERAAASAAPVALPPGYLSSSSGYGIPGGSALPAGRPGASTVVSPAAPVTPATPEESSGTWAALANLPAWAWVGAAALAGFAFSRGGRR
jgi:hypothetical protein